MDAIVRHLQSFIEKIAFVRFRALPVWVGVGRPAGSQFGGLGTRKKLKDRCATVAKVIEFYVPETFRTRATRVSSQDRGKVIEFRAQIVHGLDTNGREGRPEPHPLSAVVDHP